MCPLWGPARPAQRRRGAVPERARANWSGAHSHNAELAICIALRGEGRDALTCWRARNSSSVRARTLRPRRIRRLRRVKRPALVCPPFAVDHAGMIARFQMHGQTADCEGQGFSPFVLQRAEPHSQTSSRAGSQAPTTQESSKWHTVTAAGLRWWPARRTGHRNGVPGSNKLGVKREVAECSARACLVAHGCSCRTRCQWRLHSAASATPGHAVAGYFRAGRGRRKR